MLTNREVYDILYIEKGGRGKHTSKIKNLLTNIKLCDNIKYRKGEMKNEILFHTCLQWRK